MRAFFDIFGQMLRTLWSHKLRSFLTMFGIAWGVGSLLLLVGLGEGFRSGNRKQMETMGENIMFMFPGRVPAQAGSTVGARPYQLTYRDYEDIRREATMVHEVSPILVRQDIRVVSEHASSGGQVLGVTANFDKIRHLPLAQGRWLNELDNEQRRQVVVIGEELEKNLFPRHIDAKAMGSVITLNGLRFEIVGVLKRVGRGDNNATNSRAIIPYAAMRTYFPLKGANLPPDAISFLNYNPVRREAHDAARQQVRRIVARNHGFDYKLGDEAFEDWDTVKAQQTVGQIFNAMNWFLGGVGLVTLALGAIGIINIMLVSVGERTREIGLRKALGATNRSVLTQFFLEGAFLTLLSGALGIAGAAGFMTLLGMLPQPPGFDTPRLVPWSAALAMASLSLAGIIAGIYPARKAALMAPVDALRKE